MVMVKVLVSDEDLRRLKELEGLKEVEGDENEQWIIQTSYCDWITFMKKGAKNG